MATYHCSVKVISRSAGRSSVAAAAYRSGDRLTNDRDGLTHDYTNKRGVEHSEIMLPEKALERFADREILWNEVEQAERRKDAQTAREIEIALPAELDTKEQAALIRDYTQRNFVDKGMCADFSIHDTGSGNPHAHIMLTTRSVTPEGFGPKDRTWNDRQLVEQWREDWAKCYNQAMEKKSLPDRVDHRSLKDQGIDREPTVHMGRAAQLEKRGIKTERGSINRQRQAEAEQLHQIDKELQALAIERDRLTAAPAQLEPEPPTTEKSAEQIAAALHELRDKFTDLSGQLAAEREKLQTVRQQLHQTEGQQQNLQQDRRGLLDLRTKASQLEKAKTESKGAGRRQLDSIQRSQEQARAAFRQTWSIDPTPKQIDQLDQQLQNKIEELRRAEAEPAQNVTQLQEQQKAVELDYKAEKILADLHPDREQIERTRSNHRQPVGDPPGQKQSIRERLRSAQESQRLDNITKADYKAILDRQQRPEIQAKILQHSQHRQQRSIDRGR